MVNVKGAVYMVDLNAATLTAFQAGIAESLAEIVVWVTIGIGRLIAAVVLLRSLKSGEYEGDYNHLYYDRTATDQSKLPADGSMGCY
jgi:hypothetical protein